MCVCMCECGGRSAPLGCVSESGEARRLVCVCKCVSVCESVKVCFLHHLKALGLCVWVWVSVCVSVMCV